MAPITVSIAVDRPHDEVFAQLGVGRQDGVVGGLAGHGS